MDDFSELLAANRRYADDFGSPGLAGAAAAGVAVVTCMDSRIDPLALLGLGLGDAKVVRNPGGRVTDAALEAVVLATTLLGADTVLVVPHTRCAVASSTAAELTERVGAVCGVDASWLGVHATADQRQALLDDVQRIRSHPLVPDTVKVGGFLYDVDTGRLQQLA